MKKLWIPAVLCLALGAVIAVRVARGAGEERRVAPRAEGLAGGAEVRSLELAVPFVLDEPWTHVWRAEQPSFRAGWLVVLEVDPALVRATELAQPVLCAGVEILERYHHGEASGRVVALLPEEPATDGAAPSALERDAFYFAGPALPESLTQAELRRELSLARARGRAPFAVDEIALARQRGGAPVHARDRVELDRLAAELIARYAPEERERADALRVPVSR
jgi:hypothetical protein